MSFLQKMKDPEKMGFALGHLGFFSEISRIRGASIFYRIQNEYEGAFEKLWFMNALKLGMVRTVQGAEFEKSGRDIGLMLLAGGAVARFLNINDNVENAGKKAQQLGLGVLAGTLAGSIVSTMDVGGGQTGSSPTTSNSSEEAGLI